jgi:hypothetical protein
MSSAPRRSRPGEAINRTKIRYSRNGNDARQLTAMVRGPALTEFEPALILVVVHFPAACNPSHNVQAEGNEIMVTVILDITLSDEGLKDFLANAAAGLPNTRKFPGCISVVALQDRPSHLRAESA